MKTPPGALLGPALLLASACDESKYDKYKTAPDTGSAATEAVPSPLASAAPAPSPAPAAKKKSATDCKPHPATIDFDDPPLEAEVRRKLGKDAGAIRPADLAQIRSINLANSR